MIFGHLTYVPIVHGYQVSRFSLKLQDLEEFDGSRNKLKTLPSTITKGMLFHSSTVYNVKWNSSIMEQFYCGTVLLWNRLDQSELKRL